MGTTQKHFKRFLNPIQIDKISLSRNKMNRSECANCLVHDWKQPEDSTRLLKCQNCQVIEYCSKECQSEHWMKLHKSHCEFKDPSQNEPWQHVEQDCAMCLQAAAVGEEELKKVDNPNYECIFRHEFPEHLVHPHPFLVTGQSGDILEKGIIVLWQLVRKFQLNHPHAALTCHEEFQNVERNLQDGRIAIWRDRKIFPQSQPLSYTGIHLELSDIANKVDTVEDPFELRNTIFVINQMVLNVDPINKLKFLKDPLSNLPDDLKNLVSEGMNNATKYPNMASKVFEALTNQVIPFKEVLKIIAGGSLEQECNVCFKEIDMSSQESFVFNDSLHLGKYSCGSEDCRIKEDAALDDVARFHLTLNIMWVERGANMCDFYFERSPVKPKGSDMPDIHRCRHYCTTMYCSQECLYGDDEIHFKVCQKDKEGRKKKPRGSARRKVARRVIEKLETEGTSDIYCEVLDKFKLKNARKISLLKTGDKNQYEHSYIDKKALT